VTTGQPDLSVVVVTHNRSDLAMATLRSARSATGEVDVEWLVVDSGSTDETPDLLERNFHGLRVLRRANVGFAAANNVALKLARGRYILLLNPDVEIVSGTLAQLVSALDSRPEVGIASVIQQNSDSEPHLSIRRYPSPKRALGEALALPWNGWREEEQATAHYHQERSADWLVGAFLIARRETVEQIGGFDERFFLYSEEADWCFRARAAGWDVRHLPQMVVTHYTGSTTTPELIAQLSYAKVLFAYKHYGPMRARAIHGALMARHLLRIVHLARLAWRQPQSHARLRAERHALAVIGGHAAPPFPVKRTTAPHG
jgi:GT2 family glycosyltransferase